MSSQLPGRLAGAPISWGVCEVPGWGLQLPPERVFAEMAELGLSATELGPQGWLPADGAPLLERFGLQLVGGFVPVVVHEPALDTEGARRAAAQLAGAGGEVFVAAAVMTPDWAPPVPLDADGWRRAGEHLDTLAAVTRAEGVELVLHPHADTLLETARDVELALAHTRVPWCFDTGHLLLGGTDPLAFATAHAGRIGHVHLKDVDAAVAARTDLTLMQAVQHGLFRPLGTGDARIAEVIDALAAAGYDGWLVLEQDLALADADADPRTEVAASLAFLEGRA